MTPDPCTTQARRLRHLSNDLKAFGLGRQGRTLCNLRAYDETIVKAHLASFQTARAKPFVLADLPECKKCARAARGSTR